MDIVVIDADCAMCSAFAHFVLRRDRSRRFLFSSATSNFWTSSPYRNAADATRTVVLVADNRVYTKSEAALRIARSCGGVVAPIARLLMLIPTEIRDAVYDFIAARRRMSGRVCALPPPAESQRFLP